MVERIYDAKRRVLEYADKELDKYGKDRMDVAEMDKLADIIKDLSEAEKACWEAEYYRSVTEAMEGSSGYDGMPRHTPMGYSPHRDSMGRYTGGRRGYGGSYGYHENLEGLREQFGKASPDEREKMKREMRQIIDS